MKFYETHYDDYDRSVGLFNFHDCFTPFFQNYIFYGPSGVGKYSQMIHLIKKFSPSGLKFENKIFSTVEKHAFFINISDIHYEVDMSLLGCNSKIIWHDIFLQITDIISLKPHKKGFIVCKNFHEIHNELLEIFYSYMNVLALRSTLIQRKLRGENETPTNFGKNIQTDINIKFILLTEQISFIPNNILNKCKIQSFGRPSKENIIKGIGIQKPCINKEKIEKIIDKIPKKQYAANLKDIYSYVLMDSTHDVPKDNFVIICENIIKQIEQMIDGELRSDSTTFFNDYAVYRDIIYDILVYNLEPLEAIRYIFFHFLKKEKAIKTEYIDTLLTILTTFMFQYNNNYRSFFHLEYFLFSLMNFLRKTHISNYLKDTSIHSIHSIPSLPLPPSLSQSSSIDYPLSSPQPLELILMEGTEIIPELDNDYTIIESS